MIYKAFLDKRSLIIYVFLKKISSPPQIWIWQFAEFFSTCISVWIIGLVLAWVSLAQTYY